MCAGWHNVRLGDVATVIVSNGEVILYDAEDGTAEVQLRVVDGTVWLTQAHKEGGRR